MPGFKSQSFGKNPQNMNLLVGKPDADSAAAAANGPGIGTTLNPAFLAALTTLKPGSDSRGVPASQSSATSLRASSSNALPTIITSFKSPTEINFFVNNSPWRTPPHIRRGG